MNRIPITEAAKLANITREQARYWSRLLDLEMIKDGRISYLAAGSENMLLAMAESVKSGQAPAVAASEIKTTFAAPVIMPKQPEAEQGTNNQFVKSEKGKNFPFQSTSEIIARLNNLERAVILLAENNKQLLTENRELAAIISRQNTKLDTIAARLPAPPPEVAPIRKIHKTEVKVPLLKRLWLELFDPIQLRATP